MAGYRHGKVRDELLGAAIRLSHERGIASVRLRDVAIAAGVSPGSISGRFPTRRSLLEAVAYNLLLERQWMLDDLPRFRAEPYDVLAALVERLGEEARCDRGGGCAGARLFLNLGADAERVDRSVIDQVRATVLCVERFVEEQLSAAGLPPEEAARAAARFLVIWQGASLRGQLRNRYDGVREDLREWLDHWSNVL